MRIVFPPRSGHPNHPQHRPPAPRHRPHPPPPQSPPAVYAYSHIRSTVPLLGMDSAVDSPSRTFENLTIDSPPANPACEECVQECENEDCEVQLTEQCTDQCVVVPCNDAHHDSLHVTAQCACDLMCVDGADRAALDNFLQCCADMDYHQLFPDAKQLPASTHWPAFTDQMFPDYIPSAPSQSSSIQSSLYYTHSSSTTPQLSSPQDSFSIPSPRLNQPPGTQSQISLAPTDQAPRQQQQHCCMWADCGATFTSMNELVGHVNLQHLRLPSMSETAPLPTSAAQIQLQQQNFDFNASISNENPNANPNAPLDPSSLSCLWADCRVYPTPSSIPGPSIGDQTNNIIGFLASHLMQDHLGLTASPAARPSSPPGQNTRQSQHQAAQTPHSTPSQTRQDHANVPSSPSRSHRRVRTPSPTLAQPSSPTPSPPTPAPEHDCTSPSAHECRWRGCGETFSSCDALTTHITSMHVGAGKAHYECLWEGCRRNSEAEGGKIEKGEGGFSSKQKICRHLQSHTGHRPFQCKTCQQYFSEAATLAQHMRRHTQEKPYVCDFPGCGKSFAITGALTIHKRTHNGHKPFKCTFCERAFTESSNLSKHLRTHTGARPYSCTEPGCAKTFARPDQLARHCASVHQKKLSGSNNVQGRPRGGSAEDGPGRGEVDSIAAKESGESRAKLEFVQVKV